MVTHFLLSTAKSDPCFSYVCKIKPALKFLADSMDKKLVFSDHMIRLLTGLKRRAAKKRLPAKKAPILPLDTLKSLVKQEIIPFRNNPHMINKVVFRTIFRTMIEYFLHCRFNCFSKLEAQHFLCYDEKISVIFPSGKNDQLHNSTSSTLIRNGTDFCPHQITQLYFKSAGFAFGNSGKIDHSKVSCRVRKSGGVWIYQKNPGLGRTTAVENLRNLLKKHGFPYDYEGVTDKSAKMEGVTHSLEAGASLEEVQFYGRWLTLEIPFSNKRNSETCKAKIARA